MVAKLEHLTFTNELKTTLLKSLAHNNQVRLSVNYDADFDALIILFAPTDDAIAHYISDDHVALLYEASTKEIVGMQIEDFAHSFLPQHSSVDKIWRLSKSDAKIEDLGDMMIVFQQKKPQVAREVFKATEDLLKREHLELGDVFA